MHDEANVWFRSRNRGRFAQIACCPGNYHGQPLRLCSPRCCQPSGQLAAQPCTSRMASTLQQYPKSHQPVFPRAYTPGDSQTPFCSYLGFTFECSADVCNDDRLLTTDYQPLTIAHLTPCTFVQPFVFFEAITDSNTATHLAPSRKSG